MKYKQERNYFVKLLRKKKMKYFQNMDVSKVNNQKMFWKTVKPRFSNKYKTANTIILTERDMIMKNDIQQTLSITILLTLQKL